MILGRVRLGFFFFGPRAQTSAHVEPRPPKSRRDCFAFAITSTISFVHPQACNYDHFTIIFFSLSLSLLLIQLQYLYSTPIF